MNRINSILLFALIGLTSQTISAQWVNGVYAVGMGQPISEVPWSKITHMNVCCAAPAPGGVLSQNFLAPYSYAELRSTAAAYGVKLILSIDGTMPYWPDATSAGNVATFAQNIANYVNANLFDGVDVDWEHGIIPSQYSDLIARLRGLMPNKLITMDGGNWDGLQNVAATSYPYLNQINVMCYDMANGNGYSWHDGALLQAGNAMVMTCDWRVRSLTNLGVPKSKIGIGIAYYGYAWSGATVPEVTSASYGTTQYTYNKIVTNPTFWNGGLNHRWDSTYKADYLSIPATNQFLTYNDTTYATETVNWAKSQGFGGYMLLYLQQEYIAGASGDARFPVTSALFNAIGGIVTPPPTTPPPVTPPPPPPPTTPPPTATSGYLSDMTWVSATNGWGSISRDRSIAGNVINLRGTTYTKGLGVHATSQVVFNLGGTCTSFTSMAGIDNETNGNGSVVFKVLADGALLYQSGTMGWSTPAASINVSLTGRNQLTLLVEDGGNGMDFDHADWANAAITCGGTAPPPTASTYYVSNLNWTSATNGWGAVAKDLSIGGKTLTVQGTPYAKGLGVHANSTITYTLGGKCSAFQAIAGVDAESGTQGSVKFQVLADGVSLFSGPTQTGTSAAQTINVSVTGRNQLTLTVTDGGNGIDWDHADWADAKLTCTSAP